MDRTIEGKAYINGSFEDCCIGIKDGKINKIKKILKSNDHINFGNKLILPAGIDIHTHFRDPGYTHKEDFETGSISAAYGGIACVFDMPNTKPPTITLSALMEKIQVAEKKSYVDFGIFAGINDKNIENIENFSKYCCGFKIFLGSTTNSFQLKSVNLNKVLVKINKKKMITLFHAEDQQCLKEFIINEQNLKDHLKARPSKCEEISIKKILGNAKNISSKIHICHISSIEGLNALKGSPKNVSVGVTPHHLFFEIGKTLLKKTYYKVNPPLRTNMDREFLWQGINSGLIDVLESDHAPHTIDEKDQEFDKAPSGIPGIETMFPLFLAEVKNQNLSFNRLISMLCEKPSELLNIPKGKIEKEKDADLIVVDFKKTNLVKSDDLHSKCGWSPYEGKKVIFPSHVFLRGEEVVEEYELVGSKGFGCNIKDKIT